METKLLMIFATVIPITGIVLGLYFFSVDSTHYDLEIQGMKDAYFIGETYSFYYTLSGFGTMCGSWLVTFPNQDGDILHRGETVDCSAKMNSQISYDSRKDSRIFSLAVPQNEGKYNVTVSVEPVNEPVFHEFIVISKNLEDDKRRFGFTPAFEYHKVQIDGEKALQICSLLNLMCPQNPMFHAINRHDKNYTYFYYDLPSKDYLVVVDGGQICYTTDDEFEDTGAFEKCVEIESEN